MILLKMAFRNIGLHKKQSLLSSLTLVLAVTMISLLSVSLNGMEQQNYQNYIKIQSGHVIGIWEDVKEIGAMSPERLLYLNNKQLEAEEAYRNGKLTRVFKDYVASHFENVEAVFYQVRQNITLKTKEKEDTIATIYSLSQAHAKWLIEHESVVLEEGQLLGENGICISREKAEGDHLALGDEVELVLKDMHGEEKHLKRQVTGIYQNKAQYENYYIFIDDASAYLLAGYDEDLFDMARIYLKNPKEAKAYARSLDEVLLQHGQALRAEDYGEASIFFTQFYGILKVFYQIFFAFVLGIMAVGLSAMVHMNLMTRMVEFGTLRAIGYSKMKCYGVIFLELFILAIISMAIALSLTLAFVGIFGEKGLYVGQGAVTYMLGGESFCPEIKWGDILFCVGSIGVFALVATIQPSLRLLNQDLTDLLAKRQRRKGVKNIKSKAISCDVKE